MWADKCQPIEYNYAIQQELQKMKQPPEGVDKEEEQE